MSTKQLFCDPCSGELNSTVAVKYCSECEENLCDECAEFHLRFKMFKSHHLIDLSSLGPRMPFATNLRCELHTDVQLDFYCIHHDLVCCRACIPDHHSSCKQVYPLDIASKDVRNSALLSDTVDDLRNISETLDRLLKNRNENLKFLARSKLSIIKRIRDVKVELLKNIDVIERKLIEELDIVEEKTISTLKSEEREIKKLNTVLKTKEEELLFLKEHGSNNQLFLALQKQVSHTKEVDVKIQDIVSSLKEMDFQFERSKDLGIISLGSIVEITRPCDIKYSTYKSHQAQVQPGTIRSLTMLKPYGEVKLKIGEQYDITGMAVTADNKLLVCNFNFSCPKVYIYKHCETFEKEITFSSTPFAVAVIPCSDKAVVTLPDENSIHFIKTANYKMKKKINVKVACYGITATKDNIYAGGLGTVHIFSTDGSKVTNISTEDCRINCLHYVGNNDQIVAELHGTLCCIDLHGIKIYQYKIPGIQGLAIDQHGNVYISENDSNEVQRLSSDGKNRNAVLKECDGVKSPGVLSFNHDFTKLFVVSDSYGTQRVLSFYVVQ